MTPPLKALGTLAIGALISLGATAECFGGVLQPDQLAGVRGVVVSAVVYEPGSEGDSRSLEALIEQRAQAALTAKGISTASEDGLYLRLRFTVVDAKRDEADANALTVMAMIQFLEPVLLKRDPSREVPGGGALTWWAERLELSKGESVQALLARLTDELVSRFVTDWETVNPRSGPTAVRERANE